MSTTPYPILESRVLRVMAKMDNTSPFLRGDALWCRFFRWAVQKEFIVMPNPDTRPTYRIKRLEWKDHGSLHIARTAIGNFLVGSRGVEFAKGGVTEGRDCTSLEDGKRVAQDWFEEIMREGLEEA